MKAVVIVLANVENTEKNESLEERTLGPVNFQTIASVHAWDSETSLELSE